MSFRNSPPARVPLEVAPTDRLLDAARACIMSVGWKRTTLTDVARRAGVSRMTVYRHYSDLETLFGDLMTREWSEVVDTVLTQKPADDDWAPRIAQRVGQAVASLRSNELFRRIIDVDPESLLPYLLDRPGRAQDSLLELLTALISQAQEVDAVRKGDPGLLARTLLLTAHGFALSASTMVSATSAAATPARSAIDETDLDAQLVDLIRRYLAP